MKKTVQARRDIRVLSDEVIDQIAAGEVVERPASVVKELVENALDAGATHVNIEVESGGKQLIRVLDNGIGMTEDEVRLALRRHATSKLRTLDDVFALGTMGFRGEALPSIASVSRMTVITRTRDQVAGIRLEIEGGQVMRTAEVGAPVGTQLEVRDLLYNVPARLKFLKGNATEASHVTDAVSRLAMVHPHVHLRLRHGGRVALEAPMHPSGLERARAILGARLGRRLHAVTGEESGVLVEAYLAAPELAQSTSRAVHLFVGRRSVRDRGLLQAINMGYGELVPKGRYPVAVLRIEVPGGEVDVNVHPQKLEVRFSDAQAVYAAVRHVVRRGVAEAPWLAEGPGQADAPVRMRGGAARPERASRLASDHAAETTRMLLPFGRGEQAPPRSEQGRSRAEQAPPRPEQAPPRGRPDAVGPATEGPVRGLTRASFPLAPQAPAWAVPEDTPGPARRSLASRAAEPAPASRATPGAQRAADAAGSRADAVDLDATNTRSDAGSVPAPVLRPDGPAVAFPIAAPEPVTGDASRFFSRLRYIGQLDRTYLICESEGEMVLVDQHAAHERVAFQHLRERYQQRAVPVQRMLFPKTVEITPGQGAMIDECSESLASMGFEVEPFGGATYAIKAVPAGLREADAEPVLLELLDELAESGGSRALEERLDLVLATIACHSVVRAGDVLSNQEVHALFHSLDQVEFKAHCPHGRPVLLRISVSELARRFGRT